MTVYTVIITLVLVMDPFGNIPAFLSLLHNLSPKRRRLIILRELLIALGILTLFLFFGQGILASFNIGQSALRISGGVILFLIALRMIFPADRGAAGSFKTDENPPVSAGVSKEPLIVPLAVPLVAGPSAMAYVILISTQYPERLLFWLLGLAIAWAICAIVLLAADFFARLLGEKVLTAIERLMGMILTTLAVQMLLEGLKGFFTVNS